MVRLSKVGVLVLLEQLDVELQPAHPREVVLARIEEHAVEQRSRRVQGRRIAGTQLAVDFDQRFLRRLHRIALQGLADHGADVVALREENVELDHADSRIFETLSAVSSELASSRISPVVVSTTSLATQAPSRSDVNFDLR
jgi:hypothetical protein